MLFFSLGLSQSFLKVLRKIIHFFDFTLVTSLRFFEFFKLDYAAFKEFFEVNDFVLPKDQF